MLVITIVYAEYNCFQLPVGGRRRDKSRQYIYATLKRTHATPGTAKSNRGISLLTEKIAQSRFNSRMVRIFFSIAIYM